MLKFVRVLDGQEVEGRSLSPRLIGLKGGCSMRDVMRQVGRRRIKRLFMLGSVCGGLAIAMMRLAVQARAMEGTSVRVDDCSTYIVPPPECQVDETYAASGYSNDQYYDPNTFPWPASFDFWGIIEGHPVVGYAEREGTNSLFDGVFYATDGGGCTGMVKIDIGWTEAIEIQMGLAITLESWWITESSGC